MRLLVSLGLIFFSSMYLQAQTFFGNPKGIDTFENTRIGKALAANGANLERSLKSKEELNEYFQCHISNGLNGGAKRKAEARLQEFNAKYRPLLELSTQHYQIPYALSSCIMFRETLFDNNRVSSAGAMGMAQFMKETYKQIKLDMAHNLNQKIWQLKPNRKTGKMERVLAPSHEMYFQEYRSIQDSHEDAGFEYTLNYTGPNPFIRAAALTDPGSKLYDQVTPEERENSRKNSRALNARVQKNREIFTNHKSFLWDYSKTLSPAEKRRLFPETFKTTSAGFPEGIDLLPPSSREKMIQNPMWVVSTNQFYLKKMMLETSKAWDGKSLNENDALMYLVMLAGGYNGGSSCLRGITRRGGESLTDMCRKVANCSSEAKNYMLDVRSCMTAGSMQEQTGNGNNICSQDYLKHNSDPCAPMKLARPRARPANLKIPTPTAD